MWRFRHHSVVHNGPSENDLSNPIFPLYFVHDSQVQGTYASLEYYKTYWIFIYYLHFLSSSTYPLHDYIDNNVCFSSCCNIIRAVILFWYRTPYFPLLYSKEWLSLFLNESDFLQGRMSLCRKEKCVMWRLNTSSNPRRGNMLLLFHCCFCLYWLSTLKCPDLSGSITCFWLTRKAFCDTYIWWTS